MNFGEVILRLTRNSRAYAWRKGWHGKNMRIYIQPGRIIERPKDVLQAHIEEMYGEAVIESASHFNLLTDETLVVGWLASQTDMLANDWEVDVV